MNISGPYKQFKHLWLNPGRYRVFIIYLLANIGPITLVSRHYQTSLLKTFFPPNQQVFHDVAYKAKDRNDLIAGIDEFLDQVTVLPPGEWDPSIRIEPPKNVPSQVRQNFVQQPGLNLTELTLVLSGEFTVVTFKTGEEEEEQHFTQWFS